MLEPLPTPRPPERLRSPLMRDLPSSAAVDWLIAGWRDFRTTPGPSLAYGVFLTLLSYLALGGLAATGLLYLALPAISGFLILGPFLAIGLYEKSRRLHDGAYVTLQAMVMVRPPRGRNWPMRGSFWGFW